MTQCAAMKGLKFHHINGDSADNRADNILVLCVLHHELAHEPRSRLDRKTCELLKEVVSLHR
jgi:predicted restriction endonuclease